MKRKIQARFPVLILVAIACGDPAADVKFSSVVHHKIALG